MLKEIRLELLQNYPTYFGSSFLEEKSFSDEVWKNRLSKKTVTYYGMFDQNKLIGIAVVVKNPRSKMAHSATINSVYVRPAYQHKGVAIKLLNRIFKDAHESNIEQLTLSVVSSNTSAIKLYNELGFVEYGRHPKSIRYEGKYYEQILMIKEVLK
jgi:ribosomal protein S18 acetylase RimI-like enzyme